MQERCVKILPVPKRTNAFQTLIALIEQQLASDGVTTVTESEMLNDRLTGKPREVDAHP